MNQFFGCAKFVRYGTPEHDRPLGEICKKYGGIFLISPLVEEVDQLQNMKTTLGDTQVLCWHCEEPVHRYAMRCPYCQHTLKMPTASSEAQAHEDPFSLSQQKTKEPTTSSPTNALPTPAKQQIKPQTHPPKPHELQKNAEQEDSQDTTAAANNSPLQKILMPLIALLAGSFFFFFGMFLKLFSKNGKLTLEWHADSWPYFVFPAICLLLIGVATLSHAETDS